MVPEQPDLDNHMDKVDIPPYIRINSKWAIKLNGKPKTLKFLKERKEKVFVTLGSAKVC